MGYRTSTWKRKGDGDHRRLPVPRRLLLAGGGVFLCALFVSVVLAGVTVHLQQETARLLARSLRLVEERNALQQRVDAIESEIGDARAGLALVRAEEAKIRAWLGLEEGKAAAEPSPAKLRGGGKGSVGDEGLDTVASPARDPGRGVVGVREGPGIVAESEALADDLASLARHVQRQKALWDAVPAVSPVDGEHWISSAFGWRRSPFTGEREFHNGMDMAGRKGTPIVAAADGTVDKVFNDPALGKGLAIDHGNGIRTIYGHLDELLVRSNQPVRRGDRVGRMGSSGLRSTGPHLHYGVKVDGKYVNPKSYLLEPSQLPFSTAKN